MSSDAMSDAAADIQSDVTVARYRVEGYVTGGQTKVGNQVF